MEKPDGLDIAVLVESENWPESGRLETLCHRAISSVIRRLGRSGCGDVCILFTDDDAMKALNAQFRDKPTPTNVLSFPAHARDEGRAGDIALGRETVFREAAEKAIEVEDHIVHLVIHGFLHLQGYDHQTDMEAEEMESVERGTLQDLGIADPYEDRR
ncbi:rRNA maturation RNase YbeY [Hyphobacterium sp. HN65]|uniref:Endoribonuclease YbeY n=1 Tax=Hyphobacterium lacteum TaxID=3116575 RepID=A0ABU7LRZ7_9PROT|nr:rRNA maturation RNase YbeY [Hyphobacterium sp. HN65]MEE2526692.1 rRNA maturation RNase YbeY [Hyphobacterium sp. HN65]